MNEVIPFGDDDVIIPVLFFDRLLDLIGIAHRADNLLFAVAVPDDFLSATGDPVTGEPVGPTPDNLKSAIAGETYEYTEMYPGFARTARDEGFTEIAEWFETLARAERSHAGRFKKGLDNLE